MTKPFIPKFGFKKIELYKSKINIARLEFTILFAHEVDPIAIPLEVRKDYIILNKQKQELK